MARDNVPDVASMVIPPSASLAWVCNFGLCCTEALMQCSASQSLRTLALATMDGYSYSEIRKMILGRNDLLYLRMRSHVPGSEDVDNVSAQITESVFGLLLSGIIRKLGHRPGAVPRT